MTLAVEIEADSGPNLVSRLMSIVGAPAVTTDAAERQLFSQDIFQQGQVCAAVVRPRTAAQVQAVVKACAALDHDVVVRGGGMSYTGGYLPRRTASVIVDLSGMSRILEVNTADMFATVEAGCTWHDLNASLRPLGLRTPYWGPLSGLRSTVGGAISQNSVFFGSALHGTAADSVIGLEVVLADGSRVVTGSAGTDGGSPFLRHYGPDLNGLFTGDAGAFGIKTAVTLRLLRRPQEARHLSFSFRDRDALLMAMQAIAREGLASEVFGFDPFLQQVRMKRADLMTDVKTLGAVIAGQGSAARGLSEGLRMAFAGRRFADGVLWPLHITTEGRTSGQVEEAARDIRRIARRVGGRETANTVPKAVHASPFGPMNGIIGVSGERWVPVHGVVPNSRIPSFMTALDQFYTDRAAAMQAADVTSGYLMTAVGPGASLIEPVFYWPDARMEIHERSIEPSFLSRLGRFPDNPAGRALVAALRTDVMDLFAAAGAVHFQVGKTYPYRATRDPSTGGFVDRLKGLVDPAHLMNPGALGLSGATEETSCTSSPPCGSPSPGC